MLKDPVVEFFVSLPATLGKRVIIPTAHLDGHALSMRHAWRSPPWWDLSQLTLSPLSSHSHCEIVLSRFTSHNLHQKQLKKKKKEN